MIPFTVRRKLSVRIRNRETPTVKVNDADGNPIEIAAVVVWQVRDSARATYGVEDFVAFVGTQSETALRHVANSHPYDDAGTDVLSLRGRGRGSSRGRSGWSRWRLTALAEEDVVPLYEERKAAMVSNLLVVLCGDRGTKPIVNAGSLYQ